MDVNGFKILVFAVIACVMFSAEAQNIPKFRPDRNVVSPSRLALDSLVYPSVLPDGGKVLKFDTLLCDLGQMKETDPKRTAIFTFFNATDSVQHITLVRTTCGCASAQCDKRTLQPGEKGKVTLTFNPYNQPGTVDVSAFVYTTRSKSNPMARLTLIGKVEESTDQWRHLPAKMEKLRLKRKSVTIQVRPDSKIIKERIAIANSGNTPLKISAPFLPKGIGVSTEPETIAPSEDADLVITIDTRKLSRAVKSQTILLEGIGGRPSERTITLNIERLK